MNIKTALAKFLVQLEADGRSLHTIRQYERHVRLFGHWAREVGHSGDISKVTHEDVAQFLISPQARTRPDGSIKKASSTNCLRTSIKGFFGYLHQAGYIRHNPTRLARRAICGTPPPRGMTEAEVKRLMDTLAESEGTGAHRDNAMFHLMLATGIRLGSVIMLDVEDIDFKRGEIWLKRMKGDRQERVFLNLSVQDHLRRYIGDRTTGPLFQSRSSGRVSQRQVQRQFTVWLDRANITTKYSCHSLRHTFACNLYQKTGDIFLVKEALKHRSIVSTLVYAHADEDRLRNALQA